MKRLIKPRIIAAVAVLLCASLLTDAQAQKLWRMIQHGDSLLTARYRRGNIDTMYITRPNTKWTFTARYKVSGNRLEVEGMQMDKPFKSRMDADYKYTVSLGVNYLGLSLSLSLNPAKMMGKYKDFELNINTYNNRWGLDFIYQNARNFTGWHDMEGEPRIDLPTDVLSMKSLNVNAYYAFNHRRFSYPAAFTQSYIQRRSAGSFMIAISGQGQKTETNSSYKSLLKVTNIGIGGGYGYNWVPSRNWLLHLSALPTFTVYSHTSLRVNDERIPLKYHFPEVIITGRGAVIRQFGNFFVGASMAYTFTNVGNRDQLAILNTKWIARLLVGFRL